MPYQIAAFIFILSICGRQIMQALVAVLPLSTVKMAAIPVCILGLGFILKKAHSRKGIEGLLELAWIPLVWFLVFRFFITDPNPAAAPKPQELLHLVYFGALGLSCFKNMKIEPAIFTVVLVSVCDELIQSILPYRSGEIRDAAINIIGGIVGLMAGAQLFEKK